MRLPSPLARQHGACRLRALRDYGDRHRRSAAAGTRHPACAADTGLSCVRGLHKRKEVTGPRKGGGRASADGPGQYVLLGRRQLQLTL
jgi:hypothetical protein